MGMIYDNRNINFTNVNKLDTNSNVINPLLDAIKTNTDKEYKEGLIDNVKQERLFKENIYNQQLFNKIKSAKALELSNKAINEIEQKVFNGELTDPNQIKQEIAKVQYTVSNVLTDSNPELSTKISSTDVETTYMNLIKTKANKDIDNIFSNLVLVNQGNTNLVNNQITDIAKNLDSYYVYDNDAKSYTLTTNASGLENILPKNINKDEYNLIKLGLVNKATSLKDVQDKLYRQEANIKNIETKTELDRQALEQNNKTIKAKNDYMNFVKTINTALSVDTTTSKGQEVIKDIVNKIDNMNVSYLNEDSVKKLTEYRNLLARYMDNDNNEVLNNNNSNVSIKEIVNGLKSIFSGIGIKSSNENSNIDVVKTNANKFKEIFKEHYKTTTKFRGGTISTGVDFDNIKNNILKEYNSLKQNNPDTADSSMYSFLNSLSKDKRDTLLKHSPELNTIYYTVSAKKSLKLIDRPNNKVIDTLTNFLSKPITNNNPNAFINRIYKYKNSLNINDLDNLSNKIKEDSKLNPNTKITLLNNIEKIKNSKIVKNVFKNRIVTINVNNEQKTLPVVTDSNINNVIKYVGVSYDRSLLNVSAKIDTAISKNNTAKRLTMNAYRMFMLNKSKKYKGLYNNKIPFDKEEFGKFMLSLDNKLVQNECEESDTSCYVETIKDIIKELKGK